MEVVYATDAIHDFLESLEAHTRVRTMRLMDMLEEYGNNLRLPHSRALGSGLFELRLQGKHAVRLIYCFVHNRAYIVLACMKKQGTLLRDDIDFAQRVRQVVLAEA